MQRLDAGCRRLGIIMPAPALLEQEARTLAGGQADAILKILITRGSGGRGYRPPSKARTTRLVCLYPLPEYPLEFREQGIRLRHCRTRLGLSPDLAGLKHLNRLEQVLARAEWDDMSIAEGLMSSVTGNVIEGTMTNLFAVINHQLVTPELDQCGVAGVMRSIVLEESGALEIPAVVTSIDRAELARASEVFVCNSIIGIWPVIDLDGTRMHCGPVTRSLKDRIGKYGY